MTNSITTAARNNFLYINQLLNQYGIDGYYSKTAARATEVASEAYYTTNLALVNNLPKSIAKAVYIDLPANLYSFLQNSPKTAEELVTYAIKVHKTSAFFMELGLDKSVAGTFTDLYYLPSFQVFYKTAISATTYEIRAQSKDYLMKLGLDQNTAGALAGFAGGSFKYYMTGQNPVIGALNNAAYELCNNDDFCSNNIYANTAFTIAVESIDAAAQATIKLIFGDTIGAAIKITEAVEKISENITKSTSQINVANVAKTTGGKILSAAEKITQNKALEAIGKGAIESSKQITEAAIKSASETTPEIIQKVAKDTLSAAFNFIKEEAIEGAMTGVFVSFDVHALFVPALAISESMSDNTCSLYGISENVFSNVTI